MEIYQPTVLETLGEAVAASLEGLAFVDVEEWKISDDFSLWNGKGYHVYLDIDAPLTLRLHLLLDPELTREIVATILVEEPESVPPDLIADTLGEILNTLAGRFAGELQEYEPVIGLPTCRWVEGIPDSLRKNDEKITIVRFKLDLGILYAVLESQDF